MTEVCGALFVFFLGGGAWNIGQEAKDYHSRGANPAALASWAHCHLFCWHKAAPTRSFPVLQGKTQITTLA